MTPLEPRLIKKLQGPLCQVISTTSAMSLLLEAIRALVLGGMVKPLGQDEEADKVMQLIATKLKGLLEHPDPNCKTTL